LRIIFPLSDAPRLIESISISLQLHFHVISHFRFDLMHFSIDIYNADIDFAFGFLISLGCVSICRCAQSRQLFSQPAFAASRPRHRAAPNAQKPLTSATSSLAARWLQATFWIYWLISRHDWFRISLIHYYFECHCWFISAFKFHAIWFYSKLGLILIYIQWHTLPLDYFIIPA
jgi:hypothetical protein